MGYTNVCWACHTVVDSERNVRCKVCGWLICKECYSCAQDCNGQDNQLRMTSFQVLKSCGFSPTEYQIEQYICMKDNFENELLLQGYMAFSKHLFPSKNQLNEYIEIYNEIELINDKLMEIMIPGVLFNFILMEPVEFVLDKSIDKDNYVRSANKLVQDVNTFVEKAQMPVIEQQEKLVGFKLIPMEKLMTIENDELVDYIRHISEMNSIHQRISKYNNKMKIIKENNKEIKLVLLSSEFFYIKGEEGLEFYIKRISNYIKNYEIYLNLIEKIDKKLDAFSISSINFNFQKRNAAYFLEKDKYEFTNYIKYADLVMQVEENICSRNLMIYYNYPELIPYLRESKSFVVNNKVDENEIKDYLSMLSSKKKDINNAARD